jgi:hypothetical protein
MSVAKAPRAGVSETLQPLVRFFISCGYLVGRTLGSENERM